MRRSALIHLASRVLPRRSRELALAGLVGATTFGALPAAAAAAVLRPLTVAGTWASAPIHAASPVGDGRLFVVERGGVVRIMQNGVLQSPAFLTVPNVDTSGERGLLSIAFPIDYATSGRFYVFASIAGTPAQTRVIEYRVSSNDPNLADPTSARTVLAQDLGSAGNHNGGQLAFGGDRKLYVTLGDNAARERAQSMGSLLGKVLRIDPLDPDGSGPLTYAVPADNPFSGSPVWALGLRNPYRAAFDDRGRLVIADVGESTVEEINIGQAGANYGWPTCEGTCRVAGLTNPFHTYLHTGARAGCSITGGIVVRDARLTGLAGRYLFGDYCQGDTRTVDLGPAGPDARAETISTKINGLIGFAEDARGCAYVIGNGTVSRIATTPSDPPACDLTTFLDASVYPPPPPTPAPVPTPTVPAPSPTPPAPAGPDVSPMPAAATPTPVAVMATPIPTPKATPKPFVVPRNCVRSGQMSIRSSKGRIQTVRRVSGKRTIAVKFKRNGVRVEVRSLPSSARVTLRTTVRTPGGRTLVFRKTYRACR
ncbi:MAG: PQQ-dependent sugar dehydrogenase [Solirubrobacteraceae bacterium]|nr:PQQ-dependent sugar dehydrogenase [Solirubrobacteraceae bacterium]